jgi:hypothetical protein
LTLVLWPVRAQEAGLTNSGDSDKPPLDVNALIASATGLQADLVSDARVDPEEWERALFATVECMEARGVDVVLLEYTLEAARYRLTYRAGAVTSDAASEVEDECTEEFLSVVAQLYGWQVFPSRDEAEARAGEILTCLRDRGAAVPDGLASDVMIEIRDSDEVDPLISSECRDGVLNMIRVEL